MQPRKGDWIQTFTGKAFYPFDPRPEDICIQDIAHALSNLCRWGGHCSRFYSVAEHSVYVSREVAKHCDAHSALAGLLHDATEAYLVDLPRPIKNNLPGYKDTEAKLNATIMNRFGIDRFWANWAAVHTADNAVLFAERNQLMSESPQAWGWDVEPADVTINCFNPQFAKTFFLAEFKNLAKRSNLDVEQY